MKREKNGSAVKINCLIVSIEKGTLLGSRVSRAKTRNYAQNRVLYRVAQVSPMSSSSQQSTGYKVERRISALVSSSGLSKPSKRTVAQLSWQDVVVLEIVGEGNSYTVHHALVKDESFAVKRINRSSPCHYDYTKAATNLVIEGMLLSRLEHPNIVEIYGVKEGSVKDSVNKKDYFIVEELLENSLENRLDDWSGQFARGLFVGRKIRSKHGKLLCRLESVALGIANAMKYLHSKRIAFRDLNPSKIQYSKDGTPKLVGLSSAVEIRTKCFEQVGTLRYMAPEVLMGQNYGLKVDVYSFGLLLWELATLQKPFYKLTKLEQFRNTVAKENKRPKLSAISYHPLRPLVERCWHADPMGRPSFREIVEVLEKLLVELKGEEEPTPNNSICRWARDDSGSPTRQGKGTRGLKSQPQKATADSTNHKSIRPMKNRVGNEDSFANFVMSELSNQRFERTERLSRGRRRCKHGQRYPI